MKKSRSPIIVLTISKKIERTDSMNGVFTKEWWIAVAVRMIKTFAEGCLAVMGSQAVFILQAWFVCILLLLVNQALVV